MIKTIPADIQRSTPSPDSKTANAKGKEGTPSDYNKARKKFANRIFIAKIYLLQNYIYCKIILETINYRVFARQADHTSGGKRLHRTLGEETVKTNRLARRKGMFSNPS